MDTLRCVVCQGAADFGKQCQPGGRHARVLVREHIAAGESPEQVRALSGEQIRRLGEFQAAGAFGHAAAVDRPAAGSGRRPVAGFPPTEAEGK